MNNYGLPNLRKKYPFKFSIINFCVLGFVFCYIVSINLKNLNQPEGFIAIISNTALYIFFSFPVAIFVWVIRKKKEWAGTYTLNTIVLLILSIQIAIRTIALSPDIDGIAFKRKVLKAAIQKSDASMVTAYDDFVNYYLQEIGKGISYYSTSESLACEQMMEFAERNLAIKKNWENTLNQITQHGMFDKGTILNKQELFSTKELLEDHADATKNYIHFFEIEVQDAIDKLEKMDSESELIQNFIQELRFHRVKNKKYVSKVLKAHYDYAAASNQLYELFQEEKTKFNFDSNGKILFKDKRTSNDFFRLSKQIDQCSEVINSNDIWYLTFF